MASSSPRVQGHGRLDEPPLDMEFINRAMTFTPSERCTVSCGTVCVDPHASRVLIILNRRLGIWQLPKGRKNIGEDLHAAALRETYEETGVHAALLSLKIRTRSTKPLLPDDDIDATAWCHNSPSTAATAAAQPTAPGESANAGVHRPALSVSSASSASTASSASIGTSSTVATAASPSHTECSGAWCRVHESGSFEAKGASHEHDHEHEHEHAHAHQHKPDTGERQNHFNSIGNDKTNGGSSNHSSVLLEQSAKMAPKALTADPKLTSDIFNNELVGLVQYPDLQAATPSTIKTVFFFAALADSTAPMGPGAQEEHEDLLAEWVDFDVASQRLRFGPEKEVMWKVKQDMERSGIGR